MNNDLLFKQDGDKQVVDTDFLDLYVKMAEEEKNKPKDYELSDIIKEVKNYPSESNMSVSDIMAEVKNTEKPQNTDDFDLESILKEFRSSKEEKQDDEYAKKFVLWEPKETPKEEMLDVPVSDEIEHLETPQITNLEPEIEQRIANEDAIYQELMSIFQKQERTSLEDDKQLAIKDFKNRLKNLWDQCIIKTPKPWDNPTAVAGTGLINIFYYNKNKIIEHSDEIMTLLSLVKSTTNLDELGILNDGQEWTQTIQPREILMSLGDALNTVKFRTLEENAEILVSPKLK